MNHIFSKCLKSKNSENTIFNENYKSPSIGILRLDYNYPPAKGDIDHPDSFNVDVFYRVVPGLTFEMCQSGTMTTTVKNNFKEALLYLENEKKVNVITGDCGFMMYFQEYARQLTHLPVLLSSLTQLPSIFNCISKKDEIIIMTANSKSLEPMRKLIIKDNELDYSNNRINIIGCEDVPGFEAVSLGNKVDINKCTKGIVKKSLNAIKKYPNSKVILLECTELPPYSDSIRKETKLPVFDAITNVEFLISGFKDNKRFGEDFQETWDGKQEKYEFGDNLTKKNKSMLVNKI